MLERCRFACLFAKLKNTFDLWIGKIWKLQLMLIHHYVGVPTCIWNVVMGSIGNLRVQCYFSPLRSGGHFFQFCCQRFILQSIDEIVLLAWLFFLFLILFTNPVVLKFFGKLPFLMNLKTKLPSKFFLINHTTTNNSVITLHWNVT